MSFPDGALRVPSRRDGKYLAYDRPAADNTEQRDVCVLATTGAAKLPLWSAPATTLSWAGPTTANASSSPVTEAVPWDCGAGHWQNGKIAGSPELLKTDIGQILGLGVTDGGKLYAVVNTVAPPPFGAADVLCSRD